MWSSRPANSSRKTRSPPRWTSSGAGGEPMAPARWGANRRADLAGFGADQPAGDTEADGLGTGLSFGQRVGDSVFNACPGRVIHIPERPRRGPHEFGHLKTCVARRRAQVHQTVEFLDTD